MIEISVASGKGGVGKSTVSASIALRLAKTDRKLVVVDADADAPNMHLILGIEEWDWEKPFKGSFVVQINQELCIRCGECQKVCPYQAIYVEEGRYKVNEVICEGCYTCSLVCPVKGAIVRREAESGRLRRVMTGYGFPLISAKLNPGRPNTGKLVTEEKAMARDMKPDLILVDSAAGIGCQVVSSLAGANMAILVAEPTPSSFNALKRVHKLTRHFMQPSALVINKYDIDEGMTKRIEEYAQEKGMDLLGRIPYDDAIPKSMAIMRPVVEAFPGSPATKALLSVADRVVEIVDNWADWFRRFRPKRPEPYKPLIIKPEGI